MDVPMRQPRRPCPDVGGLVGGELSMTMWTSKSLGARAPTSFRKSGNSSDRWRLQHLPMTKPVAMSGAANGGVVPLRL